MEDVEIWRPVVDYEGIYEVSTLGSVKRIAPRPGGRQQLGEVMAQNKAGRLGYRQVTISKHGQSETKYVAHLVLETFVGPRPPGYQACYRDRDISNNRLDNLFWDSVSNVRKRSAPAKRARLTPTMVRSIRRMLTTSTSMYEVATKLNVSESSVLKVKRRQICGSLG